MLIFKTSRLILFKRIAYSILYSRFLALYENKVSLVNTTVNTNRAKREPLVLENNNKALKYLTNNQILKGIKSEFTIVNVRVV